MNTYIRQLLIVILSISAWTTFAQELEFDMIVSSYSKSFTITIPGSLLDFSATERTPDNLTMTNNWDIFTDAGISMDTGDVLLIVDYFADASTLDLPADSDALDATHAMISRSSRESTEPSVIVAGDYSGYLYENFSAPSLFFTNGMFDVDDGAFAGFTLLTTSDDDTNIFLPVALEVMGSLTKGLVFERVGALDLQLSETYVRESDRFTMPYPEGWSVEVSLVGQTEFVTVTKGHAFDLASPPKAGEPSAIVAYGTMTELTGLPSTMLSPDTNAMRVIQTIIGAAPEEIVDLEIKGYKAAQVVSLNANFDNWFVAIMLDGNHFIATNIFTAPDEDVDFFGTLIEMITEAQFGDLAGTESDTDIEEPTSTSDASIDLAETFVSENNGLSFQYPTGWLAYDVADELSALINTQDAFDALTQQLPPASGQIIVTIFTHVTMDSLGADDVDMRLTILNSTVFTDGVDDLEATELNGQMLYIAEGSLEDADKLVILISTGDHYELISALTASGELDDFRETIMSIALSMTVVE